MTAMPAAADDEPICEAQDSAGNEIFTCTRPPGHQGDHGAHGVDVMVPVHTWPRDGRGAR